MRFMDALRSGRALEQRDSSLSFDDYLDYFKFGGNFYPLNAGLQPTLGSKQEEPLATFPAYVNGIYKRNGVVFACMVARQLLFSEARFQFQRLRNGRPGELFGTRDLEPLEEPWPGGNTGQLLSRAIQDVDLGGNFFAARRPGGRIMRLRPDWVTIILGSRSDPDVGFGDVDSEVLGYIYKPGGTNSKTSYFLREEVAHFAPIPDPEAEYRGMSWITPIIREVMADKAATDHKLAFFENGASPNFAVMMDAGIAREEFEAWLKLFREKSEGSENAYKTLYLGAGAKIETLGVDLKSVDFKAVQALGENRIAVAARVPGIIVGLSEGLEAATYSNFGQARRAFADGTMRPLWREICGALSTLVPPPEGTRLWFDDRDISFLQDDRKDNAEIQAKEAATIEMLIKSGFEPDTVVEAVNADDLTRLEHSGLVSVQLQEPGAKLPPDDSDEDVPIELNGRSMLVARSALGVPGSDGITHRVPRSALRPSSTD